jgi:hypothetical protein
MFECEAQETMFAWDDQFDNARVRKQRAGCQVHSRLIGTERLQMQVKRRRFGAVPNAIIA